MTAPVPHDRRWQLLGVIGIAQLMVVLDVTIVNIALPSAQQDLGFSADQRQWVITAYALAFGGLLLLGGRIGDVFGRKRVFVTGLLGFAGASAVGGAATSFEMLVAARACQGAFGALLAPAALSLLTTTFTDPQERGKAFAIYAAIAGMGGAIGLLLGGALTQLLDWRWCLYVSVVFALPAAIVASRLLIHVPTPNRPRLDVRGALVASTGLFALVFGLSRAETDGWGDPLTIGCLVASALLLTTFVVLQKRTPQPLLPLKVVSDRDRGASFIAIATASAGLFGLFLFLTYYLQLTKGFSAFETGLAFLPMSLSIAPTVGLVTTKILARTGPRPLVPTGMLLGALGMLLLTRLTPDSAYATHVLPSLILIGIGFGLTIAPSFATATYGIPPRDAGVASAMVNTSQQIGGSIGAALLSSVGAGSLTTAYWWAAGLLVCGALVTGALFRTDTRPAVAHGPDPVTA
ncbi:MFS transporter [Solirubrobacter soli]|uniref:MFS transporter n=1 Tax=Solirubrobacter soli TaxID=363832 RepID=UPI00040E0AFE|nr:MFS transporter [Solirubrobacter soli]